MLDCESGLLGVSGISSDLRDLLASTAPEAGEAVDLFCYRVVRELGAMVATLEGLDAIVFTGGIGENSPDIRRKICSQVKWVRSSILRLIARGNTVLNSDESRVSILRIPPDEEALIARYTAILVTSSPASSLKWKTL
jgi:acetate kinase